MTRAMSSGMLQEWSWIQIESDCEHHYQRAVVTILELVYRHGLNRVTLLYYESINGHIVHRIFTTCSSTLNAYDCDVSFMWLECVSCLSLEILVRRP